MKSFNLRGSLGQAAQSEEARGVAQGADGRLDEEPGRAVHPCLLPGLVSRSCEAAETRLRLFSTLRKSRDELIPSVSSSRQPSRVRDNREGRAGPALGITQS